MDYKILELLLGRQLVLPIFRGSREEVLQALNFMKPLKLEAIELTTTINGWQSLLRELAPHYVVGVGTVTTEHQIKKARENGASFLVSFGSFPKFIQSSRKIPVIPGALTPSEFLALDRLDIPMAKLYPASSMGTKYLKDLTVVLPNMKFIATGGITIDHESLSTWLDSGALAVGMGNALGNPITNPDSFSLQVEILRLALERLSHISERHS
jgi:2-dehydro-3-deoxyphosphogluconate aldolase/(4S)-4-hydroxy-2-oxoglutarate aldolase